ncbi:CENP-B N-terminal DNA-binding domain [Popillia japonica]|uniref:CENP-B N-terminal DNA-binding domain n=1 Tax=Popillia japonica TaxID=7064 RepID=A0AAW1IXW7_POPJA
MESRRKRKVSSVEEKFNIVCRLECGEANASLCKEFELPHSTISTIWKSREKIKNEFESNRIKKKNIRKSSHQDIDTALLKWFKSQRARSVPINEPVLKGQAEFGKIMGKTDYKCSETWIQRFRNRHNIVAGKIF